MKTWPAGASMGDMILAISSLKGSVNELKMRVRLRSSRGMVVLLVICREVFVDEIFVCCVRWKGKEDIVSC